LIRKYPEWTAKNGKRLHNDIYQVDSHDDNQRWKTRTTTAYHIGAWKCPTTLLHGGLDSSLQVTSNIPGRVRYLVLQSRF
jgi:hypothetical protein